MLLPVRHTTAPRTPGQFIKLLMVLGKQLHYVALYFRFQVKMLALPWGSSDRNRLCFLSSSCTIISVKNYFLSSVWWSMPMGRGSV